MKPFPYQEEGARWLASKKRALLGDGMRCGKTIQSVIAADLIGAKNVLVVCPGLAREVWRRHFEQASFFGRSIAVVMDSNDPIEPDGVTIVSMDGSRNETVHAQVMRHRWDVMILDETHFLKSKDSQRTKQVLSKHGFAAVAERIWFLSGTPMLNGPQDLWVALRTMGATVLDYEAFLNRFCVWFQGDYGPVVKDAKNVEELRALLAPVMLRRTWNEVRHQVMKNPPPDPEWHDVYLDPLPQDVDHDWYKDLRELEASSRVRAGVARLIEQIERGEQPKFKNLPAPTAAHRRALSLAKSKPISNFILAKLATYEFDKVVIFAHHRWTVHLLREYLKPYGAKCLYGGTDPKDRQKYIDRFSNYQHVRVLICQDNIARQAIDLSAADNLVFAELDWVAENNAQAAMRIQGPLQRRQPHIWNMIMNNTLDADIIRICARKTKMAMEILG